MTSPPTVIGVSLIDAAAWASGPIPWSSGGSGLAVEGSIARPGLIVARGAFALLVLWVFQHVQLSRALGGLKGCKYLSFYLTCFLSGPLLDEREPERYNDVG